MVGRGRSSCGPELILRGACAEETGVTEREVGEGGGSEEGDPSGRGEEEEEEEEKDDVDDADDDDVEDVDECPREGSE